MMKFIARCSANILVACLFLSSAASAEDYFYYYLGEPIHLTTMPDTLAVYDRARGQGPAKAQGQNNALGKLFEDAQIEMFEMKPHPIGAGWHTVKINTEEAAAPGGPPEMITRLIDHDNAGRFFFSPVFLGSGGDPIIVPSELLVLFEEGVSNGEVAQLLQEGGVRGASREAFAPSLGMAFKVNTNHNSGIEVLEVANRLTEMAEVVFAEPDMIITGKSASIIPNEPEFNDSWGLRNIGQFPEAVSGFDIGATDAWCETFGDPDVITVVIDTGAQQDHPDINQIPGRDFTFDGGDGGPVNECDNHGTTVAGVISGKINLFGTAGVAPDTQIASARAFISDAVSGPCDGRWFTRSAWTVGALQWALDIGARITNNSNVYGVGNTSNFISQIYKQTSGGVIHFASAGNEGGFNVAYPANLDWVHAITAMDWDGNRSSFSDTGPEVAFAAPGSFILSTDRTSPNGFSPSFSTTFVSGTSYAAPMVAGVAALILSKKLQQTPFDVFRVLRFTARDLGSPGHDSDYGFGLVNAGDALKLSPGSLIFFDGFESGDMSYWSDDVN